MGGKVRVTYQMIAEGITAGKTELELLDIFCNDKKCQSYINTQNRKMVNSFFNVISALTEIEVKHPEAYKDPKWASHFVMGKHKKMRNMQIQLIMKSLNNAGWSPQPVFTVNQVC